MAMSFGGKSNESETAFERALKGYGRLDTSSGGRGASIKYNRFV